MKKKQNALSGLSFVLTAAMALGTCLPYLGSIEIKAEAKKSSLRRRQIRDIICAMNILM